MNTDMQSLRAALREKIPRNHGQLLPALHFLQHEYGHLPDWAMEVVGWHLGIPSSEVYGAATSYSELRIQKPGAHVVRVCTGLSCRANGALDVLGAVESELGIHCGETTADESATLEQTPCGFLCGMAPAVEIDGSWRGRLTPESARNLVKEASKQ